MLRVLAEWRDLGVDGWLDAEKPWFTLANSLAAESALPIGAAPEEVAIANSTTVNLHQLLATLFAPDERRHAILADSLNFPSDLYAIQSHLCLRGLDAARSLKLVPSGDGRTLVEGDIVDAMTGEVAIAILPAVLYASGQLLDMERLAREPGVAAFSSASIAPTPSASFHTLWTPGVSTSRSGAATST